MEKDIRECLKRFGISVDDIEISVSYININFNRYTLEFSLNSENSVDFSITPDLINDEVVFEKSLDIPLECLFELSLNIKTYLLGE